jgi:hypothetical protein
MSSSTPLFTGFPQTERGHPHRRYSSVVLNPLLLKMNSVKPLVTSRCRYPYFILHPSSFHLAFGDDGGGRLGSDIGEGDKVNEQPGSEEYCGSQEKPPYKQ